jgi:hypothetical protein
MRLTKAVIEQLLVLNEGLKWTTSSSGKNFSETRHYLIQGGKLLINAVGKTSWADSRYDTNTVADIEQTRRFLRSILTQLKTK